MRRSVFDDFIFYDRKNNEIWIGRRDIALNNVWRWCCYNGKKAIYPKSKEKLPKHWTIIDRQDEMTLLSSR